LLHPSANTSAANMNLPLRAIRVFSGIAVTTHVTDITPNEY
jgi:hypothetical protein